MEDEERAHRDTYFQEELESLKANMTRLTSLLNQTCGNGSGKCPTTDLSPLIRLQ
jgi:hypothetical protein